MKWEKWWAGIVFLILFPGSTFGQTGTQLSLKELTPQTIATPLFEQGRSMYRAGQYETALQKFEAARQAGENAPQLGLYLGMTYAQLKQWEKTLAILMPLESQHASEGEYWFLMGTAQSSTGRFQEARASLRRSVKLAPRNGDAYRVLGFVEFQLNNPNEALFAWAHAVDINPRDAKSCYSIARLFYDANNTVKAREWFQKTLVLEPDDYRTILYLGLSHEAEGHAEQALQCYRQALKVSRERQQPYSWIYSTLGKLLRNSGEMEAARAVLEEGYRLAVDAQVCLEYGQLLIKIGEKDKAEGLFRQAIQLEPGFPGPYYQLGLLLRSQGKTAEARKLMATFQVLKEKEKKEKIRLSVRSASNSPEETPAVANPDK